MQQGISVVNKKPVTIVRNPLVCNAQVDISELSFYYEQTSPIAESTCLNRPKTSTNFNDLDDLENKTEEFIKTDSLSETCTRMIKLNISCVIQEDNYTNASQILEDKIKDNSTSKALLVDLHLVVKQIQVQFGIKTNTLLNVFSKASDEHKDIIVDNINKILTSLNDV